MLLLKSLKQEFQVEVLASQPKVTVQTNKDWVNIHIVGKNKHCGFDWRNVERCRYIPSSENVVLLRS